MSPLLPEILTVDFNNDIRECNLLSIELSGASSYRKIGVPLPRKYLRFLPCTSINGQYITFSDNTLIIVRLYDKPNNVKVGLWNPTIESYSFFIKVGNEWRMYTRIPDVDGAYESRTNLNVQDRIRAISIQTIIEDYEFDRVLRIPS